MKELIKVTWAVLAIIFLAACNSNGAKSDKSTDTTEHMGHDSLNMEESSTPVAAAHVQLKDDKLNAVYEHYVHLTNALVKDDLSEARIAGNAIEVGAAEIPGGKDVATAAARITNVNDIETQRKAYASLSNEFINMAKKSGVNNGELYVDFCPMALNDKGAYWLSAGKEIKNPYMGQKMLSCGEMKETIR